MSKGLAMRNSARMFLPSALVIVGSLAAQEPPPAEWVDPSTGHRIIRLTNEPGSASLYFHQNAYTADGDLMVFTTHEGLSVINLRTRMNRPLVEGHVSHVVVGRKTRQVFYIRDGAVCATNLDTGATRVIVAKLEQRSGSGLAVNADETLLGGSFVEDQKEQPAAPPPPLPPPPASASLKPQEKPLDHDDNPPSKGQMMERRLAAHIPMALYTIDIKTGKINTFHHSTDWLNHVQFSPTDPTLIMFCHEGPWHQVDRIWTIRTDGTGLRKIHTRTMDMEIAGHEFFNPGGKIIWYDLQTPKGKEFWLAGVVLATGEAIRYKVQRSEWSVHYNVSPDGKLFAGDGGGPNSVAAPGNGQWIYLFTPHDGALQAEKLVDLSKHNYRLEPNVTFTPDGKWLVFRSNMFGPTYVFAVELRKAP